MIALRSVRLPSVACNHSLSSAWISSKFFVYMSMTWMNDTCAPLSRRRSSGNNTGMNELAALDAVDQAALVQRGDATAAELVAAAIARIEALNPALNAVVTTA